MTAAGDVLGGYRLVRPLGEGGMGEVWEGVHARLERRAAVKLLRPELSRNGDVLRRFFNEARAVGRVGHPGLVDIVDCGQHRDGRAFLIMELLEGCGLDERLAQPNALDVASMAIIGRQVASAMAAAHAAGVVHRDLKPSNLFLVTDPEARHGTRAKVLDFGIARLVDERATGPQTETNAVMGTPLYMSPEQWRGAGHVDARSDIYSLGCILFEMACGRTPYVGNHVRQLQGHITEAPPRPSDVDPRVPPELEQIILRAMEKEPAARFQSMSELADALAALLQEERTRLPAPPQAPGPLRLRLAVAAAVLGAGAIAVGLGIASHQTGVTMPILANRPVPPAEAAPPPRPQPPPSPGNGPAVAPPPSTPPPPEVAPGTQQAAPVDSDPKVEGPKRAPVRQSLPRQVVASQPKPQPPSEPQPAVVPVSPPKKLDAPPSKTDRRIRELSDV